MYRLIFSLFCLFLVQITLGQEIMPFTENYNKQDYKGDNQIWNLVQGKDHALYFANNRYFLRYNGVRWEKYTLPNKTIIRSVFAKGDRIYTGSLTEFGYWFRHEGTMKYRSLIPNPSCFGENSSSEEIWKIFEFKQQIYFQSFNELYRLQGAKIEKIALPGQISYCFAVGENLFAASITKGIYFLQDNHFKPVAAWDALKGNIVHSIDQYGENLYIFTQKDGVFISNKNKLKAWNHPINEALKNEVIITARFINKDRLVIGTASNGVYIVEMNSIHYLNINKNASLYNNSVLCINVDSENDLWLGLDNGIAHIEINSPFRIFADKSGVLGSVYSIAPIKNGYLFGSNHGLFSYQNKQLKLIEKSQGQVWNILKTDQQYIIGHNDGTFAYKDSKYSQLNSTNGGWQLKKDLYNDRYIQANYTGIVFLSNATTLKNQSRLNINASPIKDFIQLSPNELIAAHASKGLSKIKYNDSLIVISVENLTAKQNIKQDYGVKIFEFKNEHLFYTNNTWYYYDKIANSLNRYEPFNQHFKDISEIIPINDSNFAVIKNDILYLIKHKRNYFKWQEVPTKYYAGRIINNETKIFQFNHQYLINLDDGFLQIDKIPEHYTAQKVQIECFYENHFLTEKSSVPNNSSITFDFISPFYGNQKAALSYRINDEPIRPVSDQRIVINNLRGGKYKIQVFAPDGYQNKMLQSFSFSVKYPWYLSVWMFILYLLSISASLFLYYRWSKIRFIEKLKLKEEELKHQNEITQLEIENENRLRNEEHEKQLLKTQVQVKANELAGKSLTLAKQTELIDRIQHILEKENSTQTIKAKVVKVIKSNRINKNEWKAFENNLLKSNEDFVARLSSIFPDLSSKDIKLCIYLKMNLSSKEIAPLMNISYRGVEIHRYRLRKKLNLGQLESLNSFMNNLK